MPFDDSTRGRLHTFVGAARDLLAEEFSWQLQQTYGMDPVSGDVAALDRLGDPDDQRLETARFVARYGITRFTANPFFPVNTLVLMRGAVAAQKATDHSGKFRLAMATRSPSRIAKRSRRM